MTASEDPHVEWVERVVANCGPKKLGIDPAAQKTMKFRSGPWLRWNPADSDVAWAVDRYRDGIHRTDLRALGGDLSTPEKRRRAFVATLLWGAGETNRYFGRHAKALASETLPSVLEKTVVEVGSEKLPEAWSTAARMPGLGFRFFTKWLWIAGIDASLEVPPLVFDQKVRDGLVATDFPWERARISESRRWVNYCRDAAAVAKKLGVTGEWVEYWLFCGAPCD